MLQGKTALVTGSTSGIGLGIARAFAAQGANVILNGFGEAGAVERLRAGLAAEVGTAIRAQQGITMNAICPGYVWTPLVEKQIPDTAKARGLTEAQVVSDVLLLAQPTKAFVKVDEEAALASYLASAGGSSVTGAIIPIDGGRTAQ